MSTTRRSHRAAAWRAGATGGAPAHNSDEKPTSRTPPTTTACAPKPLSPATIDAAPRRLAVDAALDALADDARWQHQNWRERARLAATLSTPLALDAADRALRGGLPPAPSRPLERGVYELHVTGLDATTLAICCPNLSVIAAGDTSVLGGVLDNHAMRTVIRRLNLFGARVLAIFCDHRCAAPPAYQRT